MWDDDETTEGGEVPPDSAVKPTSDQGLARERLDAFFDELDTVRFLSSAADQVGDEFRFGAEVRMNDADPDEFDCSELVEWSAHQAGVRMPDGSWNQFKHLNRAGTTTSVEEALDTPGALLFRFGSDPLNTKGRPAGSHVAISLGDGRVVEATTGGVRIIERTEGWTHAGVIPGLEVAEDSPIWSDRPTGETLGGEPPFIEATDPAPPTRSGDAGSPDEAPSRKQVDEPDATPKTTGAEPQDSGNEPGWETVAHGGPPSEEQLDANRYLVRGAPRPATAPPNAIFDEGDLDRIGTALAQGRSAVMASNGHIYIGERGEYEPMTQQGEEFIESRLGEMKRMVEAGVSIGIRPDGTFSGNRSDGRLKVFGGPDAEIDQQEVTLITEYLESGSRVQVHADGMIELRDVPGDPKPSVDEGQRLAREFVRMHDTGELARQMGEGMSLTISHEGVEFTSSPSFAPGGEIDVPRHPLAAEEPEAAAGHATEPASGEGADGGADDDPEPTLEEELLDDAAEARRFEVALDRAADSHRSMRDEFKLERLRIDNRVEALDDQAREVTEDLTRWEADINLAEAEVTRISKRISDLDKKPANSDEVSRLQDLRTIAEGELEELLDLRRPGEARLTEIKELRAELLQEAKGFDEQVAAHTRMYEDMRSASEGAERVSKELLAEARSAAGKPGGPPAGETDHEAAVRLQHRADRQENIAVLASRAADANEAHADRLTIRITALESRVEAERAREQRLDERVERMRQEVSDSDRLAGDLEKRARASREAGQTDEAELYERRALTARARSASVSSSIRLREQEDTRGGTASDQAVSLYERQLTRLRQEHASIRAEVVELRELSASYESRADVLETMASRMDPASYPQPSSEPDGTAVDPITGEESVDPGNDENGRPDEDPDDEQDPDDELSFGNELSLGDTDLGETPESTDPDESAPGIEPPDDEYSETDDTNPLEELEESLDDLLGDPSTDDPSDRGSDDAFLDTSNPDVGDDVGEFSAEPEPLEAPAFEPDALDDGFDGQQ